MAFRGGRGSIRVRAFPFLRRERWGLDPGRGSRNFTTLLLPGSLFPFPLSPLQHLSCSFRPLFSTFFSFLPSPTVLSFLSNEGVKLMASLYTFLTGLFWSPLGAFLLAGLCGGVGFLIGRSWENC